MRPPPPLVALTPGDLERERVPAFLERLVRALSAGLPGLLVREPRLSDRDWLGLLEEIDLWLGVHDRAHLVRAVEADGLHLGFRSLAPGAAREVVGGDVALGLSTHAGDDAAAWRAADYLFHGPVKPTPSKAEWCVPVGFDGLAAAIARSPRPLLALGGLLPGAVPECLRAGAHGVAVLGGILGREDPAEVDAAVHAYLAACA